MAICAFGAAGQKNPATGQGGGIVRIAARGRLVQRRPGGGIVPGAEIAVVHIRIAVHQRPVEHRVRHAAHLMLDGEQHFAGIQVDDVLEAVLPLVAFLSDQAALLQFLVRAGEVGERDAPDYGVGSDTRTREDATDGAGLVCDAGCDRVLDPRGPSVPFSRMTRLRSPR